MSFGIVPVAARDAKTKPSFTLCCHQDYPVVQCLQVLKRRAGNAGSHSNSASDPSQISLSVALGSTQCQLADRVLLGQQSMRTHQVLRINRPEMLR